MKIKIYIPACCLCVNPALPSGSGFAIVLHEYF